MYTIKQAAARTGVPVPLLRAWEARYGIVEPSRTAAGYRLYDDEAIERLRSMRALVDAGWSPSAAASAILAGRPRLPPPRRTNGPRRRSPRAASTERPTRIDAFVAAAIALDSVRLERVLDEMFARGSFEQIAMDEVLPALTAVGDAWADGRLGVGGEHAASHAVLRRLAGAFQAAGRPSASTAPSSSACRRAAATSSGRWPLPSRHDEPACPCSTSVPTCRRPTGSRPPRIPGPAPP